MEKESLPPPHLGEGSLSTSFDSQSGWELQPSYNGTIHNKLKDLRKYTKCFYNYTDVVFKVSRLGTTQNVDMRHCSRLSKHMGT